MSDNNREIVWTSWNAIADNYIENILAEIEQVNVEVDGYQDDPQAVAMPMEVVVPTIQTPLGYFQIDSFFKPSDRWDGWIGTTNFSVRKSTKNILKSTKGVEALKIMGRYSFYVGIPLTFKFSDVRMDIERQLC